MPFASCCSALFRLFLVLVLLSSCRSERVAFRFPSPTPIANSKLLIRTIKPGFQAKDSVTRASRVDASATTTTKKKTLIITAIPAVIKRRKMEFELNPLLRTPVINKLFRHKKTIANQVDNASNGWKGFWEFILLASLPLALFGALVSAIFNVSFLAGLAYVVLGFAAFFVIVLLAVAIYQVYKKLAAPRNK